MLTTDLKSHHQNSTDPGYQEQVFSFICHAPKIFAKQIVELLQSADSETRWLAARSIADKLAPVSDNAQGSFLKSSPGVIEPLMFAAVHDRHLTVRLEACEALEHLGFNLYALSAAYRAGSGLNTADYEIQSSNMGLETELAKALDEGLGGNLRYHSIHSMNLLRLPKSA